LIKGWHQARWCIEQLFGMLKSQGSRLEELTGLGQAADEAGRRGRQGRLGDVATGAGA
jgi:hypothetical protein